MSVRKFYLTNSLNKKYEFTNAQVEHFLNSPQGLGFTNSLNVTRLGDEEILNNEQYSMPSVSGEILFYGSREKAYQDYEDFIDFLKYAPLKFYYQPPQLLEPYYIDCRIMQLDKSEYETSGYLSCPISIYGLSFWKNSNVKVQSYGNENTGGGKFYPLVRDYYYNSNTLSNIVLNVDGTIPTGFVLEIDGEVTNPRLTFQQNNVTYGIIKLDGTFDYVKVDSNDSTQQIYLEKDGSVLANPLSYQDLSIADGTSEITFVRLRTGENNIAFTCDKLSSFSGKVKFSYSDRKVSI